MLRELCRIERLTVVAVINRPTSAAFDTFDRTVMLVDGRSVYCGAAGVPALQFLQGAVEQARRSGALMLSIECQCPVAAVGHMNTYRNVVFASA